MRDYFHRLSINSWRNSLIISPALILLWLLFGWLLAIPSLDGYGATYKLLTSRGDSLAYVAVLFAIQIPLFILLLERMADAGYIRRLILPSVIKFREVLVSYVLLSFLLLLSSRASFYYFPVITLTLFSLYTVVIAVVVLFEQRKLKTRENNFVRRVVASVFKDSLAHRIESNDFFEKVKNTSFITHSFMDVLDKHEGTKNLDIRSKQPGIVTSIDTDNLEELMKQRFSTVSSSNNTDKPSSQMGLAKLVLQVRPGAIIKNQNSLIKLIIPENYELPDRSFIDKLRKSIKIEVDTADSPDKQLDDLITDFKQQLRDSIDKDSVVAIQQSLGFYSLLLDGITTLSQAVKDSGYSFTNARQEFRQFMADSVSKQISTISDILNDELQHAIKSKRADTTKEIINFIYSELLNVLHDYDTLRAAFMDFSMSFTLTRLIFDDSPRKDDTFKDEIFDYISFRLKEHTDLLLYNFRGVDDDSKVPKAELKRWLKTRMDDLRGFLLGSYRKSNLKYFKSTLKVFDEFEKDYRLYETQVEDMVELERCSLFLVATYMHGRPNEDSPQKEAHDLVDSRLKNLSAPELTKLLVDCVDYGYADKWRVDTYDLVADGQMHSVPDYNTKLKILWVDYLLQKGGFSTDPNQYSSIKSLDTTFTFSDGLSKPEDAFLIKHLSDLEDKNVPNSKELKQLVMGFIEKRKQWENDKLINSRISRKKVQEFRNETIAGYNERAVAAKIFKKANKLISVKNPNKGYLIFGWNKVFDKAAFIDDWHSAYYMQPKEHGAEIASKENEIVTEKLLGNNIKTSDINDWLNRISSDKRDRWVIFHVEVGSWFIRQTLDKHLKKDTPYHDIYFNKVKQLAASEHMYHDALPKGLYAVRVRHIGKLNIKEVDNQPVEVDISAYSHNKKLLDDMLNKPPKWLTEKGSKEEQEIFLKTMVRMYINHVFQYVPDDKAEVYYLPLDEDAL